MSSYQQSFIPDEYVTKLQKYVERMAQLTATDENSSENTEKTEDGDNTQTGESTEATEETGEV